MPTLRDGRVKFQGGQAVYERQTLFDLGHVLPIEAIDTAGTLAMRWPPQGRWPGSIDPDAEICEAAARDLDEPARRACFRVEGPLRRIFSLAIGFDEFRAITRMRKIGRLNDRVLALRLARAAASHFCAEASSSVEAVRFWPAYAEAVRPDEPLRPFWEEFGVNASSLQDARLATRLREPCRTLRVWGGLGLLCALLVDELEDQVPFSV